MEATVALCRCKSKERTFGIRFEKKSRGWEYNWAFKIRDSSASKEDYGAIQINGSPALSPEYPGCPYCGAPGFFSCGCGHLNCWDGKTRDVKCAWCGNSGSLSSGIESINVVNDI